MFQRVLSVLTTNIPNRIGNSELARNFTQLPTESPWNVLGTFPMAAPTKTPYSRLQKPNVDDETPSKDSHLNPRSVRPPPNGGPPKMVLVHEYVKIGFGHPRWWQNPAEMFKTNKKEGNYSSPPLFFRDPCLQGNGQEWKTSRSFCA